MRSALSIDGRSGRPSVLAWLMIAAAVIAGLLGMHTLGSHTAAPTHESATGHASMIGEPSQASAACAGCSSEADGVPAAMACVLALLAVLLLLPRAGASFWPAPLAGGREDRPAVYAIGTRRLLSLYELQVIRT